MAKVGRRFRIETALESTACPVFIVNAAREVVFVNGGVTELTGWKGADVLGSKCSFTSSSDRASLESLTGALCPPQEAFHGEHVCVAKFFVHHQTGNSLARLVHFFPLAIDASVRSVMGIVTALPKAKSLVETLPLSQVHAELASLRHELRSRFGTKSLVARTACMQRVLEQVMAAQRSMVSVALCGEDGSGKEQVARAIHYESELGSKTFVPIDCRRLPPREVEDSLNRLMASDWTEMTPIAAMHPGCLFLKCVNHLTRDLQARIVSFLHTEQGVEFRRRVRLIVSLDDDPSLCLEQEQLTEDFFFAVSGLRIDLPPLRSRLPELRVLSQLFLEECNRVGNHQITGIASDVWTLLESYGWPGNLNELRQVMVEAHAAAKASTKIETSHLPFRFRSGLDAQSIAPHVSRTFEPIEQLLSRVEREHIEGALEFAKSNKALAAKLLGITRHSLYRRMEAVGLAVPDTEEGTESP